MKKVAIILAGGKGERFWPLTRVNRPKQILPLATNNPMIIDTFSRLSGFDAIFIVANSHLCSLFKEILPKTVHYVVEPEPRNTAPAIALACAEAFAKFGDCIVFFETADHYYSNSELYLAEINEACKFAQKNDRIILIGIQPSEPHVGYGYIHLGERLLDNFYLVHAFKEKPDRATAQNYLLSGKYLWNAGIYVSKCSLMIKELKKHLPNLIPLFSTFDTHYPPDPNELQRVFSVTENISIDYGMLENATCTAVMKTTMPWEDIGDFNSLKHVLQCDENGNFFKVNDNKVSSIDSNDNIILTDKKIALIGVHDIAVVDTPDVLFICKRSDTSKIKNLLENIESSYK